MRIIKLNPNECTESAKVKCGQNKSLCKDLQCLIGIDPASITTCLRNLKPIVLLTGGNGSGKSRLLKLIQNKHDALNIEIGDNEYATKPLNEEKELLRIINFSCNDTPLQTVDKFPAYTISKSKEHLINLDITETALNSMLYIHGLAKGYIGGHDNFDCFSKYVNDIFSIDNEQLMLKRNSNGDVSFYDRAINGDELSPGQKYLLRMAVALFLNQEEPNLVMLLDEPETHLHPSALLRFFDRLRDKHFSSSQLWIATHAIALIAHIEQRYRAESSILYFENGSIQPLRSNSAPLIRGLVGGEENRSAYCQFLVKPDAYASNKFAIECLSSPCVIPGQSNSKDKQSKLIIDDLNNKTIIDFGAGRGRLLFGIQDWLDIQKCKISEVIMNYYAYDSSPDHKDECKKAIDKHHLNSELYFNDEALLKSKVRKSADYVFLINVLHEIHPEKWVDLFGGISALLNESGVLRIVEQTELTVGEHAYSNGFMILTEESSRLLFNDSEMKIHVKYDEQKRNVSFEVPLSHLNITMDQIRLCLESIQSEAIKNIKDIHYTCNTDKDSNSYKKGLSLAFWEHQNVNSLLNLEDLKKG